MNERLKRDAEYIEDILIETADRYKYIYWMVLAIYDILDWIRRQK